MTRKERLMATLRGAPVDRPAVCFYEINGYTQREDDPDPFNVYSDPSWKPLLELARNKTDRIVQYWIPFVHKPGELDKRTTTTTWYDEKGSRHTLTEIRAEDRTLRQHTRRDQDTDTLWILEHFVKDEEDLEAWINLPDEAPGEPDLRGALQTEKDLGDTGIISIETGDALCEVAGLMDLSDFLVLAMTETELMKQALDKMQRLILERTKRTVRVMPGRLWRIYGPEYAAPPYLPPHLYHEYVTEYDKKIVDAIQSTGGFARIHQHGKQRDILDETAATGCCAIDPIEPEPQGDVTLAEVREKYGKQFVLFGNLEINDIELLDHDAFREKVRRALREGTNGEGRGFVLMPSASPLGRKVSERALRNYEIMIEEVESGKRRER